VNGKLWQLDLFRGIGAILFKRDFNSVIFKEGSCAFVVKDKNAFMNDLGDEKRPVEFIRRRKNRVRQFDKRVLEANLPTRE